MGLEELIKKLHNSTGDAEQTIKQIQDSIQFFYQDIYPKMQMGGCYYKQLLSPCITKVQKGKPANPCAIIKKSIKNIKHELKKLKEYNKDNQNNDRISQLENQLKELEVSLTEQCR